MQANQCNKCKNVSLQPLKAKKIIAKNWSKVHWIGKSMDSTKSMFYYGNNMQKIILYCAHGF